MAHAAKREAIQQPAKVSIGLIVVGSLVTGFVAALADATHRVAPSGPHRCCCRHEGHSRCCHVGSDLKPPELARRFSPVRYAFQAEGRQEIFM